MAQKIIAVTKDVDTVATVDGSFDPQTEKFVEGQSASPFQGFGAIQKHRPMAEVTFRDISAANGLFGISGSKIDGTDVELNAMERESGAAFKSTGAKVAVSYGIAVPTNITLQQDSLATMAYTIYAGGNSGSKPFSITSGATAPDIGSLVADTWTLGDVTLASSDIGPVQSVNIDFSPQMNYEEGDGAIWPYAVSIDQWQITATIETLDIGSASTISEGSSESVSITVQKNEDGGGRASTGHKTISFDSQLSTLQQIQGGNRDDATTTIEVTALSSDYSTFPVSIS